CPVTGTWMASTTLPCTYVPTEDFTQQTLSWSVEQGSSTSTIFRRDDSGDHILLSQFRGRVSVPKHSPGDASLLIQNLEMPDSGHYTCQIIWRSRDNSLITREVTTIVKVVKGKCSSKVLLLSEPGLTLPAGASTSLSCEAGGSPPISYRWFRRGPAGTAELLSSGAELAWPSLRPSDSGTYFCEAHNRAGAGAVQRSDAVRLTVTGECRAAQILCQGQRNRILLPSPRHGALPEALRAFPSSPTLEGAAQEQGSVLQLLPHAAGTASPSCQLGGGCFLLLPPVGNSVPQQHHHGGQTPV
uniref:Uncharacterized protein n=1 Tax=Geospiza parvula TaxID=87175 RepID=A0A8C3QAF7_GEOPR